MTFISALTKPRKSSDAAVSGSGESLPTSTADESPDAGFSPDALSWNTQRPDVEPLDDPWAPSNLIPLGSLAMELETTVSALARQLGEDVVLDDIGMRCCTRATAHAVIAEQQAREAAQREREQRRREEIAAQNAVPQTRERLRKLGEAQARQQGGLLRPERAQ